MATARFHVKTTTAPSYHIAINQGRNGSRQECVCLAIAFGRRSIAVLTTTADLLGILTPLLIKYRHLLRQSRLERERPTYRTFYHIHKGYG